MGNKIESHLRFSTEIMKDFVSGTDRETRIFAEKQARDLRKILRGLGMFDRVCSTVEMFPPSTYKDVLVLGLSGIDETCLAIAAGGIYNSKNKSELPILPVLLPTAPQGSSLLQDNLGNLYTDFFWMRTKKGLQLVKPATPLPVDGIVTMYRHKEDVENLEERLASNEKLLKLTEDKNRTKKVLAIAGVNVPSGVFIPNNEQYLLDFGFSKFTRTVDVKDGIVVKGNTGSGGEYVRLFAQEDIPQAKAFATQLFKEEKDVIVEERIRPYPLAIPQEYREDLSADVSDYNIRVLTTLGSSPQVIDAEVRFGIGGTPINIHQGAQAIRLPEVLTKEQIACVYEVSQRATIALCQEISLTNGDSVAMIGLDIIIDKNNIPYVIEANSGAVGGIGTLTRLDKKPPGGVRTVFIPETREHLQRSYEKRTTDEKPILQRLPASPADKIEIVSTHIMGNNYKGVQYEVEHLLASQSNTDSDMIAALAGAFYNCKDYARALKCLDAALTNNPNNKRVLMGKSAILVLNKQYDDALMCINKGLEQRPNDVDLILLESAVFLRMKDTNKAAVVLLKGLQNHPNNRDLVFHYTAVMLQEGRDKDAEDVASYYLHKSGYTTPQYRVTELQAWMFKAHRVAGQPIKALVHLSGYLPLNYVSNRQERKRKKEREKNRQENL